eukprot:8692484-Prorocentrum_lima.AAC.1
MCSLQYLIPALLGSAGPKWGFMLVYGNVAAYHLEGASFPDQPSGPLPGLCSRSEQDHPAGLSCSGVVRLNSSPSGGDPMLLQCSEDFLGIRCIVRVCDVLL